MPHNAHIPANQAQAEAGTEANPDMTMNPLRVKQAIDSQAKDAVGPATGSEAGTMSAVDKAKLDNIATGATANSADATLLNRSNHTGTQTLSTISDAGTAAALNVPATGDAAAGEVVLGNDTRLAGASQATETVAGIAEFATEQEAIDGVDADKMLSPATAQKVGLREVEHTSASYAVVIPFDALDDGTNFESLNNAADELDGSHASNVLNEPDRWGGTDACRFHANSSNTPVPALMGTYTTDHNDPYTWGIDFLYEANSGESAQFLYKHISPTLQIGWSANPNSPFEGKIEFRHGSGASNNTWLSETAVTPGWHHLAFTCENQVFKFFIDGVHTNMVLNGSIVKAVVDLQAEGYPDTAIDSWDLFHGRVGDSAATMTFSDFMFDTKILADTEILAIATKTASFAQGATVVEQITERQDINLNRAAILSLNAASAVGHAYLDAFDTAGAGTGKTLNLRHETPLSGVTGTYDIKPGEKGYKIDISLPVGIWELHADVFSAHSTLPDYTGGGTPPIFSGLPRLSEFTRHVLSDGGGTGGVTGNGSVVTNGGTKQDEWKAVIDATGGAGVATFEQDDGAGGTASSGFVISVRARKIG